MISRRFLAIVAGVAGILAASSFARLDAQQQANDGRFTFRDGRSRTIDVVITEIDGVPGVVWPDSPSVSWDTALLGVEIAADQTTHAPYVEIAAEGRSARQYFAQGDAGQRWLNVSFLKGSAAGTRVVLRGEGITLAGQDTRLRLFDAGPDLSKPILIVAPHPDDAEIAAFGLYAHRKASVVTVTAGNAGSPTYEAVFDDLAELYLFKGRIRLIDSITVPLQGGIPPERTFNMGYFDARLAEMHDKRSEAIPEMYRPNTDVNVYRQENIGSLLPKRRRESTWSNLTDDMFALLKRVNPAIVVAPHPQLDSHRDHQFTTVALAEALARWKKPVTLLLYTNHADANRYPYGPAGTVMSLPPLAIPVVLDRVYSHPVSPSLQRLKLFALESMHDLRFTPSRQYQLAKETRVTKPGEREFDDRTATPEKPGPPPDITYLRRGPRSNELFYVYDPQSFAEMVKEFLSARSR